MARAIGPGLPGRAWLAPPPHTHLDVASGPSPSAHPSPPIHEEASSYHDPDQHSNRSSVRIVAACRACRRAQPSPGRRTRHDDRRRPHGGRGRSGPHPRQLQRPARSDLRASRRVSRGRGTDRAGLPVRHPGAPGRSAPSCRGRTPLARPRWWDPGLGARRPLRRPRTSGLEYRAPGARDRGCARGAWDAGQSAGLAAPDLPGAVRRSRAAVCRPDRHLRDGDAAHAAAVQPRCHL